MNNKLMIGVLGAGTMGNGIAHVFALHKYSVILVDINKTILNESLKTIGSNLKRQFKKNVITEQDINDTMNNICTSDNIKDFNKCDIVIEAIKELKAEVEELKGHSH